jgi:8-oxo-dGTP pyrophosphatase MutT (NUDIX family)
MVRWTVHSERSLYESEWLHLRLADVEFPNGDHADHHLIRARRPAAGTVIHDRDRGVLMLWRHRFITDAWGWEIPAGRVEPGEDLAAAAAREALEETGWQPGPLEPLFSYNPTNGLSDQSFHIFLADGAAEVGPPADAKEAERVAWLTVPDVVSEIQGGGVRDGLSLSALCWCLAFGRI